ncbi:MAG: GAF domain-containing protein [Anaerolineales bacterium]|nr:GAF domain-containing protein [Anaerolineales bacterium]
MIPTTNWPAALDLLRDAGTRINRLAPDTSLTDALRLIAETVVRLMGAGAAAVIYTYDAARGTFDPASRVAAGEAVPLSGDVPRPEGVGATALRTRTRVLSYESGLPFHPLKLQAGIRTAACYPLLVLDQPVGALYVDLRAERPFTDDELRLLDTFVPLSAVAIYNTRQFEGIYRQLQRKVVELERLQRAGELINSRPSLGDTLQEILYSSLQLTHAEHGSFRLLDKPTGLLQLRASNPAQPSEEAARDLAVDEHGSVMGWVAYHGRPVCIPDLRAAPWNEIYLTLHPEREMRSELAVPLRGPGGGVIGVLNVESPRLGAFDADHQRGLEALATQAGIAIQEAQLLAALEQITGQLARRSPTELLGLLIERACELLDVPHCVVWEPDPDEPGWLRLRAANFDYPGGYQVAIQASLLGEALRTHRPVYSADLRTDPRIQRRQLVQQMGWVSALIVPLIGEAGGALGAFGVYTTAPRIFTDWERRLLAALANHAAVAFQQAEALAQVKLAQERQAVAETFAVLGDVAANLLHRVNNLVGVIPQLTQGLLEKRPDLAQDPVAAKKLGDIEASARTAMTTARETFGYLRPFQLGPVSLRQCYQTALARVEQPAHLHFRSSGLAHLPAVLAGEEQLRLVLVNLLQNAVEALGEQPGTILVRGRLVADVFDARRRWVEVMLSDTGPGVPAEMRDRIFDASVSSKNSGRSLGFGLWWVKSWVQRFGGSIALAEPAPAQPAGCTFIIRLPVAETEPAAPAR